MSIRIDTSEWIADSLIIGDTGLGVLGSEIPSEGDHGAGYAYNDLDFPDDENKEICGEIVTWPSSGTLFAYEDTSFEYYGPDGNDTFQYRLRVDGAFVLDPETGNPKIVTVTLQVGPLNHAVTGSLLAEAAELAGVSARADGYIAHDVSGSLAAGVAQLSGVAVRIAALVTHDASGALSSSASILVCIASHLALHEASGDLFSQTAHVSGTSLNGTIVYASAPSGSGYNRAMINTTRPAQRNTRRI